MTSFIHRVDAIRILRIALARARSPEEGARIVAALSALGSEDESFARLESRANLVEALVRALNALPEGDRAVVHGLVSWKDENELDLESPAECLYCGSIEIRFDPATQALDCVSCGSEE